MSGIEISTLQLDALIEQEWLAVNRIGGFAASSAAGMNTRKYHGLLVAAMTPPVRRMVLLSRVEETVICEGWKSSLACNEYPGTIHPRGDQSLRAFSQDPFPRWAYQGEGWTLEKSLRLLHGENTVVLSYTMLGGCRHIELELRPLLALRGMHELMYQWNGKLSVEPRGNDQHRVPPTTRTPEVFFAHDGQFVVQPFWYLNTIYRREQERGYAGLEDLWNPGLVKWRLQPGQSVHFVCSTDPIDLPRCIAYAERQFLEAMVPSPLNRSQGQPIDSLLRAADQFVLHIEGKSSRDPQSKDVLPTAIESVISQYPWAPPSPRNSLLAFTGLFLVPARYEAGFNLLCSLAGQLKGGLIPSFCLEDGPGLLYTGADTSLWFINAVHHYLRYTDDTRGVQEHLLEAVLEIIAQYRRGTSLGIRANADGLLHTGETGSASTWMDAHLTDWVVTPRAGYPVEINALWFNALKITQTLCRQFDRAPLADELDVLADCVAAAFNRRFWNAAENCCFDVCDESQSDASIRPNQLLAVSLPYPVLWPQRFEPVLDRVRKDLLVPHGVRTLSPASASYQGHYSGNIVSRDRAIHNGCAFPWLLGPLVDAYLRVHGRGQGARNEARQLLQPCLDYLTGPGLGQLPELYDGDKPHRPGGAMASAPGVAEVLRAYIENVLDRPPVRVEIPKVPAMAAR